MWVLNTGLSLLLLSILASSSEHLSRSFKLAIQRETHERRCTFLALDSTQLHKTLLHNDEDFVSEGGRVYHEDSNGQRAAEGEFVEFFSRNSRALWKKAESLCGHSTTWSFPTYIEPGIAESPVILAPDAGQTILSSSTTQKIPVKNPLTPPPPLEIIPLITSGPSSNRVDLVFFGDGYMRDERKKFIRDAQNLAIDVSNNQTFATVKPLLNFWAAFTPSNESGIGTGGKVKDTPFGLYRDGTELRAVYYAKPQVAHAACISMGDACDYPILLANDPLYGGLGGRFTVTTSSEINGALVLRHELGHSIIKEGEEYDGGFAYYGPNAANRTEAFPWAYWLSTPDPLPPREERSVMPMQSYPWTMLNTTDAWVATFESSGKYARYVIRFSLSGIPEKEHLVVGLDGADLDWTPRAGIGLDRWHYDIHQNVSLQTGKHTLTFQLGANAFVGKAQLCSVEVIEFGDAGEFNATDGYIGAFPTWSDKNTTTYRPTNEGCLMRIVTTPNFCKVCTEGLWHALLSRVDLIDNISLGCAVENRSSVQRVIEIQLVALGQFRSTPVQHREAYTISWKKGGVELPEFINQTRILVDNVPSNFTVEVQFITDEVRDDPHQYLTSSALIEVSKCVVGGV